MLTGKTLIDFGRKYLGVRYYFGAKAKLIDKPEGGQCYEVWRVGHGTRRASKVAEIDCSGFTYLVCRAHGIPLPHGSYFQAQAKCTEPIDLEEAYNTAGCLVFHRNKQGRVDHVAFTVGDGAHTIEANGYYRKVTLRKIKKGDWHFARKIEGVV